MEPTTPKTPRHGKGRVMETQSFSLPAWIRAELDRIWEETGVPKSTIARRALAEYLRQPADTINPDSPTQS